MLRLSLPLCCVALLATAATAQTKSTAAPDPELDWHDVSGWDVEGRAWPEDERLRYYDRLPAAAEKTVRDAVWNLSRDSAGMMARFETNATEIWVHYELLDNSIAMPHMPATGVSGVDLYARDESGEWRWVQVTKPNSKEVKASVIKDLTPGYREYAAYLPLYNGVEYLKIGVARGSKFKGLPPRAQKPIVFYGTSITHGACASRPGMVHTAILGRRFDRPVVNLGFSGNGRLEPEVGEFLKRIDAAVFVLDCLPNLNADQVRERAIPLVTQLRESHPETPILLVEDRRNTNSWITPARKTHHDNNHAALKEAFEKRQADGVPNLHYLPGDHLLGDDNEGATDGSHPNDLGFMRQSDAFEPILRQILGE